MMMQIQSNLPLKDISKRTNLLAKDKYLCLKKGPLHNGGSQDLEVLLYYYNGISE